jgi:hypothetical protein
MEQMGFCPCLFIHVYRVLGVVPALYVDDILAAAATLAMLAEFVCWLQETFKIRDLGEPTQFLGMNVEYNREKGEVKLYQTTYIDILLKRFDMEHAVPVTTPMTPGLRFTKSQGQESPTDQPFSSLIGGLLFLAICTRPDISFAVFSLSRFLKQPASIHWEAALRILKYLKSNKGRAIRLGISKSEHFATDTLVCYTDADFANDLDDRKSVTGGIILKGSSPLVWMARKQKVISTSTAEAEGNAAFEICQQLVNLQELIAEFEILIGDEIETVICIDNQPLLDMIKNGKAKNKQRDIKLKKMIEWREQNLSKSHREQILLISSRSTGQKYFQSIIRIFYGLKVLIPG